jgi:hypothetical protein
MENIEWRATRQGPKTFEMELITQFESRQELSSGLAGPAFVLGDQFSRQLLALDRKETRILMQSIRSPFVLPGSGIVRGRLVGRWERQLAKLSDPAIFFLRRLRIESLLPLAKLTVGPRWWIPIIRSRRSLDPLAFRDLMDSGNAMKALPGRLFALPILGTLVHLARRPNRRRQVRSTRNFLEVCS